MKKATKKLFLYWGETIKKEALVSIVIVLLSVLLLSSVYAYDGTCEGVDTGITGISADRAHTCVLKSDGNVDCYGNNDDGQANDYNEDI